MTPEEQTRLEVLEARVDDIIAKDRIKTNEINILTRENREQAAELAKIRALCLKAGMTEESMTVDYLQGVFYMLQQYVEGKR